MRNRNKVKVGIVTWGVRRRFFLAISRRGNLSSKNII
jgi:hypothetical protein